MEYRITYSYIVPELHLCFSFSSHAGETNMKNKIKMNTNQPSTKPFDLWMFMWAGLKHGIEDKT